MSVKLTPWRTVLRGPRQHVWRNKKKFLLESLLRATKVLKSKESDLRQPQLTLVID